MEIRESYLKQRGYIEVPRSKDHPEIGSDWVSPDKRVMLSKGSNLPERKWSVHVDNDRFETIGYLAVNDIEMLEKFLEMTWNHR